MEPGALVFMVVHAVGATKGRVLYLARHTLRSIQARGVATALLRAFRPQNPPTLSGKGLRQCPCLWVFVGLLIEVLVETTAPLFELRVCVVVFVCVVLGPSTLDLPCSGVALQGSARRNRGSGLMVQSVAQALVAVVFPALDRLTLLRGG